MQSCNTNRRFESFHYDPKRFEEVIYQRRSIRKLRREPISKAVLDVVLENMVRSVMSDCDEKIHIYYVVNRVEGMKQGLYLKGKVLKEGDFSLKVGYLCLEQALGCNSAVTFFITTGAKNYLSAYLDIGCSGIGAYYDDETATFLGCEDHMILYALAIGA